MCWYISVQKFGRVASIPLHLKYQVSHKRSPKNGGSGQKFLIEPEGKSNGSKDLRQGWVRVQDKKEQSDAVRTTKKVLSVLFNVVAKSRRLDGS